MILGLSHDTVRAFVDHAAASAVSEREAIRAEIGKARSDERIDRALCDELEAARSVDHSRSLVLLAILGERRSDVGAECLRRFVALPLPETGTIVDGEIPERVALETLQAKAAAALAYRKTAADDEAVLRIAREHASAAVRYAALEAYLWNHASELAAARKRVAPYARGAERALLDGPAPDGDLRPW